MRILIQLLDRLQGFEGLLRLFGVARQRRFAFRRRAWRTLESRVHDSSIWIHAASFGELEMVRPLIDDFIAQGEQVGVSVFSESALPGLKGLSERCVYAGLSPRESEWNELFKYFKVKKVLISKYDFWPGLLHSASELGLATVVINAEVRNSVSWIKRIFKVFHSPLPSLWFFANTEKSMGELRESFPESRVMPGVDPRWERVSRRTEDLANSNSEKETRVQNWFGLWRNLPKPWVLVGSAWLSDLKRIVPAMRRKSGTLIVVPHSLESANLSGIHSYLQAELIGRYVLVNEMGVLAELYGHADLAMVGGGFERGIHSTLEPAIAGIPVCCGPQNVSKFGEATELKALGVLTVCSNSDQIENWLGQDLPQTLSQAEVTKRRLQYRSLLEECLRIR